MTTLQGVVAGGLLAIALLLYTFWPENVFASQRQKTRLDYLLERLTAAGVEILPVKHAMAKAAFRA